MGAEQFDTVAYGADVEEAFRAAVESAQYDHGHAGYTGTIAEKDSYVMVSDGVLPDFDAAYGLAEKLTAADDPRIREKWGPAGAVEFHPSADTFPPREGQRVFLFFGWASS